MTVRSSSHKWTVKNLLMLVIMVMVTNIGESMAQKVNHLSQREKEIELKLKQLNKQPLKSIESLNGEIIDCISITKQIAFDHPMLKNHTIQMKPSSYPYEVSTKFDASDEYEDIAQPWQLAGECPENTIPIKRITKEDLLRVDGKKISHTNISKSHQLYHPTTILGRKNGHEHAIRYLNNGGSYRGAKAKINIWKPKVQESEEFSVSQIWVLGGNFDSTLNSVEAGSMVYPGPKHDADPRFFIYWTSDGYERTGCFNHQCPGFVQTNQRVALGGLIKPISTYNGQQFVITLQIWKDPKTGNWWLQYNKEMVGYWPNELLPNLREAANKIEWGGEIVNQNTDRQHTTTEMGSGHFSNEDFGKASYVKNIKIVDMSNVLRDPEGLQTFVTRPTCYDLKPGHGKIWEVFFYYGGPGRNPRCP